MKTRRHFLGSVTKLGLLAGLASGTFFGWVKETIAKGLPFVPKKGAPMNDLIRYDPENVDPSNLDITPLDEFGTMGPTDVEVDKVRVASENLRSRENASGSESAGNQGRPRR